LSSNLVRWGGIGAVGAGLIFVTLILLNWQTSLTGSSFLTDALSTILLIVALLGQMAGIAGLHTLQRERYGRLGAVGALLAFVGIALQLILGIVASALDLSTSEAASLTFALLLLLGLLALFVGFVLLGIATLRAGVMPRWFGVLLIVGLFVVAVLVGIQLVFIGMLAYGVFWVLIGYMLLSVRGTELPRSERAGSG